MSEQSTQQEAVVTTPIICPHCGEDDNPWQDYEIEGGVYHEITTCGDCGGRYEVMVHLSLTISPAALTPEQEPSDG